MGEHEFELGSGQLYFAEPDGSYSLLGAEDNDISDTVINLSNLEASFTVLAKECSSIMNAINGLYRAYINCCPNKRVVYLSLHAKKARTRKKNLNRAFRILEGIDI